MSIIFFGRRFRGGIGQGLVAVLCMLSLAGRDSVVCARSAQPQDASANQAVPKIPDDQLNSLVAPIALYTDPLLGQVLVASTYPLEIIQLQQWLEKHKDLKGNALVAAVEKEDWDPSIQGLAALPDAVKQLAENIKWTTDLGNAFLAQQSDVMDAVQRMRMKAKGAGNLKSNEQQKVETKTIESKTVVVIQQANPQVVYVPVYNPVVVFGPPIYPYPAIYYPPPAYYAGAAIGFGVGIAIGAAWGGGWGYNCGWGRNNNINININNNYINNYNKINVNNVNRNNVNNRPSQLPANKGTWQHNPQHRGGAPYSNKQVATKYGGTSRGDSMATRQTNAQQQGLSGKQQPGASNRGSTSGSRAGSNASATTGGLGASRGSGAGNLSGSNAGASKGNLDANRSSGAGNRSIPNTGASSSSQSPNRGSSGANNIGNRQVPISNASPNTNVLGGASSKASTQASSARGASSMGAARGGGGARAGSAGRGR
jgi:hypothetical protein